MRPNPETLAKLDRDDQLIYLAFCRGEMPVHLEMKRGAVVDDEIALAVVKMDSLLREGQPVTPERLEQMRRDARRLRRKGFVQEVAHRVRVLLGLEKVDKNEVDWGEVFSRED